MRIALIGAHGSGKSTIGAMLQSRGLTHWSLGDLRRRLRNQQDCEIPPAVVRAIRHMRPGQPLDLPALRLLLESCPRRVVLDGIPDSAAHVPLFDRTWAFMILRVEESIRQMRLMTRAQSTERMWIDGLRSERDARLDETKLALKGRLTQEISNDGDLIALQSRLEESLQKFSRDLRSG